MNRVSVVAIDTGHAWVLVDYRTGRTELSVHRPEHDRCRVIVRSEQWSSSWGTGETAAVLPSRFPMTFMNHLKMPSS